MRSHRFLPHTADLEVEGRGDTLAEAIEAVADALLATLEDLSALREDEAVGITVRNAELEALVVSTLEELLFYHEAERMAFRSFAVERCERVGREWLLHGTARGELVGDRPLATRVKAVTYNDLKVAPEGRGWVVRVVFDT